MSSVDRLGFLGSYMRTLEEGLSVILIPVGVGTCCLNGKYSSIRDLEAFCEHSAFLGPGDRFCDRRTDG